MVDKDRRTYVRLHDGLPDHPKVIAVGGQAAWLYTASLCYASRQLTDGVIPRGMVRRLTDLDNPEALASALLRVGLWHEGSHTCSRCPQAGPDEYVVHDYLEHQRSAEDVQALRAKRSAAGRAGGRRSGQSRRESSKREANGEANAKHLLDGLPSKTQAETETETEIKRSTTYFSSSETDEPSSDTDDAHEPPIRHDVERVCRALADAVEGNGSKRPQITKRWRDAARLMIDKDGRTVDQILACIAWCQADDFWRGNVMAMPKLREKYDALRLAALREQRQKPGVALAPTGTAHGPSGYRPAAGTDARVADHYALIRQMEAQQEQGHTS